MKRYDLGLHLENLADPNQVYTGLEKYLDARSHIEVTELLERKAFERKHGDLRLRLSNIDGTFSNIFANSTATTRWEVRVYVINPDTLEWRIAWRGEVKLSSTTFKLDSLWCEFDAFAKTKIFWERAADIKKVFDPAQQQYWFQYEGADGYIPLSGVFNVLTNTLNLSMGGTIYQSFDLTTYATRKIRGVRPGAACNPPTGNEGRIVELDPAMSLADLLKAFQIRYNAEFYIDHASKILYMRRRNTVTQDAERNIDAILLEDSEPEVVWLDDDKVDYIYTYSYVFVDISEVARERVYIEPPLSQYNELGGTQTWVVVGFNDANVPLIASRPYTTTLPNPGEGATGWWVTIRIPQFPSIVTNRRVFRWDSRIINLTNLRRIHTIPHNNGIVDFRDSYGVYFVSIGEEMPSVRNTFNVYRRFNEAIWRWENDIVDVGGQRPNGRILELKPQVRFTEIGLPNVRQEDPFDVWAFFGRETDVELFKEDWRDWFLTKRKIRCQVSDIDLKLNQRVTSSRFPASLRGGNSYLVKRFDSDLMSGKTNLELLSL